jgi:hypothetical protein
MKTSAPGTFDVISTQPRKSSLPSTARSTNSLLGSAETLDSETMKPRFSMMTLCSPSSEPDHGVWPNGPFFLSSR